MTKLLYYFFSAVVLGAFLGLLWTTQSNNAYSFVPVSSITAAPVVDELVVYGINLSGNNTITEANVEQGQYPVQAIEVSPGSYVIDTPRRFGRLWKYDSDHNGILNANDAIYPYLAVGVISPDGKKIRFVSWQQMGIRAEVLDPKHLILNYGQDLPPGYWNVHGKLLMSDGSEWPTQHVPVSTAFLDQLTTDADQHLVPTAR